MKKLTCPKCGMEVIGGSGFWGTSKPYCSFCGWNLQLAKEIERASFRQFPQNLLLFAGFFAFVGYLSKSGFAFFPFLFLSVFVVGGAIVSWRKLKLLEVSHPAAAYASTFPLVMAVPASLPSHCQSRGYLYSTSGIKSCGTRSRFPAHLPPFGILDPSYCSLWSGRSSDQHQFAAP